MKKKLALLLAALLATATLTACGGTAQSKEYSTTVADIKSKGELIIGLDDTFAPMGFRQEDGTLVGFDIDLANAVAEVLGIKATFQPIDWNSKEMELSTGKIDCIWNGLSATPERKEALSLSNPYLDNRIIVMSREGVTVATKEDLAGLNIGIQGSSAALEAVKNDKIYESIKENIVEYPTYDEVILDLNTGRLDCMVIDEVFGNYKNTKLGNTLSTAPFDFGNDLYVVGFRKGDTELTKAVSDAIAQLAADGKAAEISNKWFGVDIVLS